jgi:hypothetical protein
MGARAPLTYPRRHPLHLACHARRPGPRRYAISGCLARPCCTSGLQAVNAMRRRRAGERPAARSRHGEPTSQSVVCASCAERVVQRVNESCKSVSVRCGLAQARTRRLQREVPTPALPRRSQHALTAPEAGQPWPAPTKPSRPAPTSTVVDQRRVTGTTAPGSTDADRYAPHRAWRSPTRPWGLGCL